jgi:hypothetical protein
MTLTPAKKGLRVQLTLGALAHVPRPSLRPRRPYGVRIKFRSKLIHHAGGRQDMMGAA